MRDVNTASDPNEGSRIFGGAESTVCMKHTIKQGYARYRSYRSVRDGNRLARRRRNLFGSSQATVWEKVSVDLPRDGNGPGRREAMWLTGRDGTPRFLGGAVRDGMIMGTGREKAGDSVGNTVGKSVGNIVENRSGT